MARSLAEIEREVSQLTVQERARLITLLIESLEPADEWDIEEGKVIAVSAEEALDRIRRSLR